MLKNNDFKYIYKKALIGIIIFLFIFAFKNVVKAETTDLYIYNFPRNSGATLMSDTSLSSYYWSGVGNLSLSSPYNTEVVIEDYNIKIGSEKSGGGQYLGYYYALFKKRNTSTYELITLYANNSTNVNYLNNGGSLRVSSSGTCDIYDSTNTFRYSAGCYSILITTQQTEYNSYSHSFYNQTSLQNQPFNGFYYLTNLIGSSHNPYTYLSNDFDFVSSNIDFYLGSELQSSFPPSGYQMLNLEGHQGVFFTAKNYQNISCDPVGDLCNATFDYYYSKEIKEAYFPLDNRFKVRYNSDIISDSDATELYTYKSSYFPLYQELGTNRYYYAFMIYNYTDSGDVMNPASYSPYGPAIIWYDSTKWNYHIVDDFNTYSEIITYDVGNNEYEINVSGLPTIKEAIEQAEQESIYDSFNPQTNNVILEFLKVPFNFLNRLNPTVCQPISISIPVINYPFSIECYGNRFSQVLGSAYRWVALAINAFLIYYITAFNIQTFKDSVDPQSDKLEVLKL